MKKTLSTILLIGALGLGIGMNGCEPPTKYSNEQSEHKSTKGYEFRKYGVAGLISSKQWINISQIEVADLDGDGDLDLVVGTQSGHVIIYENKMPQKE